MSLQNLLQISLDAVQPSRQAVARMLDGSRRLLADARVAGISAGSRLTLAYSAIRLIADAGLNAHGFRTLTSRPGHHQAAIQCLGQTLDVPAETIVVLDGFRKQRHLLEYTGETASVSMAEECVAEAERLLAHAVDWLRFNKPELM